MFKKLILLVFSILIFAGVVAASFFVGDTKAPVISVNASPKLSCGCGFDDLIDYASVSDDSNVKSFKVEEIDITSVINSKTVTYVAIDDSNNVSKLKVPVDIDDEYVTYHIENIKDLSLQVNSKFVINDYFVLKNSCGVVTDDRLKISEFDINKLGEYEVKVESTMYNASPIKATIKVIDEHAPVITLTKDEINYVTNTYWRLSDFTNIIDSVYDDVDSEEYLLERLEVNWEDVLKPGEDGYVTRPGRYEVTYTLTDSDDNVTKTKVVVNLTQPVMQQEVTE